MKMVTPIYRVKPAAYVRMVMRRWLVSFWWVVVLPFFALLAVSVADIRWAFVAAMWICLAAPFVVAWVYIAHGLQWAAEIRREHRLLLHDDDTVEILNFALDHDGNPSPLPPTVVGQIVGVTVSRGQVVVASGRAIADFFIIGEEAFDQNHEVRERFVAFLRQKTVSLR